MAIKAIILDFDGTIVESVDIKDAAFKALFKDYPDKIDEIMDYHLAHNTIVRFDKFKHITTKILGKKYTKDLEKKLGESFAAFIFDSIVACPYVKGAAELLEYFSNKVPLFLVSATPEKELDAILKARGIKKYFKRVYAVPWIKMEALRDIVSRENIRAEEAVYIGDSYEDCEAAGEAGVRFMGRRSNKSFKGAAAEVYDDMDRIKEILSKEVQNDVKIS